MERVQRALALMARMASAVGPSTGRESPVPKMASMMRSGGSPSTIQSRSSAWSGERVSTGMAMRSTICNWAAGTAVYFWRGLVRRTVTSTPALLSQRAATRPSPPLLPLPVTIRGAAFGFALHEGALRDSAAGTFHQDFDGNSKLLGGAAIDFF